MAPASTHSDAATNEKTDVEQQPEREVPQQKTKKPGFFSRSKKADDESEEVKEKSTEDTLEGAPKPPQKDVTPASFTSLFRYVPTAGNRVPPEF